MLFLPKNKVLMKKYSHVLYSRIYAPFVEYTPVQVYKGLRVKGYFAGGLPILAWTSFEGVIYINNYI